MQFTMQEQPFDHAGQFVQVMAFNDKAAASSPRILSRKIPPPHQLSSVSSLGECALPLWKQVERELHMSA